MKEAIREFVEAAWQARLPGLQELAVQRQRQMRDLLVLEEHYRTGRESGNLKRALGSFGGATVDMGALSRVLKRGEGPRGMEASRSKRVRALAADLEEVMPQITAATLPAAVHDLAEGARTLLEAFEAHATRAGTVFRTLRMALLESRALYDPAQHDAFFTDFNWRQLENDEMAFFPPFVVLAEAGEDFGALLGEVLPLLTSGRPIKVVVLRQRLDNLVQETGRAAALKSGTDLELLFIALRNLYVAQVAAHTLDDMRGMVEATLASPRPGMLSVYAGGGGYPETGERALMAERARGCPRFVYDPDRAEDFVSRLSLDGNPEREEAWTRTTLRYFDGEGHEQSLEHPMTFAGFALTEPGLHTHFTALNGVDEEHAVELSEFLSLTPGARRGKTPFVYSLDDGRRLLRLVPSQALVSQTADKMHLWHTLQELGGIHNPHVRAAEEAVAQRLAQEKEKSLKAQQAELEARAAQGREQAVAQAMRNLALRLTGLGGAEAPPASATPAGGAAIRVPAAPSSMPASVPMAAEEAAPAQIADEPWIETELCTTCDECITINKKIFAYNKEKRAIIKDPRGGPFRDIVLAAEKCSAGAIHPGKPLDPNEKDLDKWVQRAERFQ